MALMCLKSFETERYQDYIKPCMYLAFPSCSFKCDCEAGRKLCQNSQLAKMPNRKYTVDSLIDIYLSNPITQAIVFGGLEPLDSIDEVLAFIHIFRIYRMHDDDIVIYTGYTLDELNEKGVVNCLSVYKNIILKVGRYKDGFAPHYDQLLGVQLASPNQYAIKIS